VSAAPRDEPLGCWQRFLEALAASDPAGIEAVISSDASMFLLAANGREAVRGSAAIVARFSRMFEQIRDSGTPAPRFLVEEFNLIELGPDFRLADSMVRAGEEIGRRSLVFRRETDGWRILHMHASNATPRQVPAAPARPPTRLPQSLG
jgi:ketosteroid isomerase-like protein